MKKIKETNFEISIKIPSIIMCAGSAGVGKSTVIRDIIPHMNNVFLLEKDMCLEELLYTNPLGVKISSDNTVLKNERISYNTSFYTESLRDQVYASMYVVAFENAKHGKSTILDANYIKDLKVLKGPKSFYEQIQLMLIKTKNDKSKIRIPILYFYVKDSNIVRERMKKRALVNSAAKERDLAKLADDVAWQNQIKKEPVTLYPELNSYKDICLIDLSEEYTGKNRLRVRLQIKKFLEKYITLKQTGILKK